VRIELVVGTDPNDVLGCKLKCREKHPPDRKGCGQIACPV